MNRKFLLITLVAYLLFGFAYATENDHPEVNLNHKFIENMGQIDATNAPSDIKFYIQRGLMNVYFLEDRVSYVLRNPDNKDQVASRVDLSFGTNSYPTIYGLDGKQSKSKFYTLNCTGGSNIMEYKKVVYENVYEKIDLIYYLSETGALKYDFIVHPGGDPNDIKISYSGKVELQLLEDGRIELSSPVGEVYEAAPYTYINEGKAEVATSYSLKGNTLKYKVAGYDNSKTLIIDPEIEWSTFYGGESFDDGIASTVDRFGNIYVTGKTYSLEFPDISTEYGNGEKGDVVIGKFLADGTHVWTIYYGGDKESEGRGIATDDSGNVFVVGMTKSLFLPDPEDEGSYLEASGNEDIIVVKVDLSGQPLQLRTYGSFNGKDIGEGIEFDGDGLYITGLTSTSENEFPVTPGAHQIVKAQDLDAFLMRLDVNMNILWATYLGGAGGDEAYGIAVDSNGDPYITGATSSPDLPFTGNPYTPGSSLEETDVFVAKFNRADGTLVWLEYYGGTMSEEGQDIVAYENDLVYVTGTTASPGFEIINDTNLRTYQSTYGGGNTDAFAIRLNATTGTAEWSTFLGGSDDDYGYGITTTGGAEVIIIGYTESQDYPTYNTDDAVRGEFQGGEQDAFLTLLSDAGQVRYSGFIGGSNIDVGRDVSFYRGETSTDNNLYVLGRTRSADFPTEDAYQSTYNGGADIFIYTLGAEIEEADPDEPNPQDTIPSIFCDNVRNNVISLNPLFEDIFANQCIENIDPNTVVYYGSTPVILDGGNFLYLYQISADDNTFENIRDEDGNLAMDKNLTIGQINLQRYFNISDTLFVRRLVITAACVDGSGSEVITEEDFLFAFPDFSVDANCIGETIQITDNSNISGTEVSSYTYTVTQGANTETYEVPNPEIGPFTSGDPVEITLEISSDEGCVGSITRTIDIQDAPEADFDFTSNEEGNICVGTEVTFTSTTTSEGDIINYEWDLGNGTTISGEDQNSVSTTYTTEGDKTITLTVTTANGCTNTTTQMLSDTGGSVVAPPQVDAGDDQMIDEGQFLELNPTVTPAPNGDATIMWTSNPGGAFNTADCGSGKNISFCPTDLDTYAKPSDDSYITLTVTNAEGCVGMDSLFVEVDEATVDDIPEVFTPNNDGYNDEFVIPFLEDEDAVVEIFNRWGSLIYKSDDYFNNPWDGTYNGEPAPTGVYYYVISFADGRNEIEGTVTLLR